MLHILLHVDSDGRFVSRRHHTTYSKRTVVVGNHSYHIRVVVVEVVAKVIVHRVTTRVLHLVIPVLQVIINIDGGNANLKKSTTIAQDQKTVINMFIYINIYPQNNVITIMYIVNNYSL